MDDRQHSVIKRVRFILAALILACSEMSSADTPPNSTRLLSFDGNPDEPQWIAVNDNVMGGRSKGGPAITDGHLRFEGILSLENNGGFSSARTTGKVFDLSHAEAITLKVRGDGRTYQLRLATDARYRGMPVSYGAKFDTVKAEWITVRIPLAQLSPTVRGTALSGPPIDGSKVRELGLLIGDKREGPFRLDVAWIAAEQIH